MKSTFHCTHGVDEHMQIVMGPLKQVWEPNAHNWLFVVLVVLWCKLLAVCHMMVPASIFDLQCCTVRPQRAGRHTTRLITASPWVPIATPSGYFFFPMNAAFQGATAARFDFRNDVFFRNPCLEHVTFDVSLSFHPAAIGISGFEWSWRTGVFVRENKKRQGRSLVTDRHAVYSMWWTSESLIMIII